MLDRWGRGPLWIPVEVRVVGVRPQRAADSSTGFRAQLTGDMMGRPWLRLPNLLYRLKLQGV